MSAVLQPITVRPIKAPDYRNDRIRSFGLWYADNEPKISEYYQQLCQFSEDHQPMMDYFEFAVIQHEIADLREFEKPLTEPLDPRRGEEPICANE